MGSGAWRATYSPWGCRGSDTTVTKRLSTQHLFFTIILLKWRTENLALVDSHGCGLAKGRGTPERHSPPDSEACCWHTPGG